MLPLSILAGACSTVGSEKDDELKAPSRSASEGTDESVVMRKIYTGCDP